MLFRRHLAPTQWAVGDCPPLKESPGRGPAARRKFSNLLVKINDFLMEIVIILIRVVFFEWLNCNVNHQSCRIIKKLSKNYLRVSSSDIKSHQKNFHDQKKVIKKIDQNEKNYFPSKFQPDLRTRCPNRKTQVRTYIIKQGMFWVIMKYFILFFSDVTHSPTLRSPHP